MVVSSRLLLKLDIQAGGNLYSMNNINLGSMLDETKLHF